MRRLLRVPRPGTVIGMLALLLALGGTASAALPGNNQVFSTDIVNGQVRAPDIATNAVRAGEIQAGAVGSSEILDGQVRAPDMGALSTRQNTVSVAPGAADFVIASCNAGEIAISGGGNFSPINNTKVAITGTFRQSTTNWEVGGANNDNVAHDLLAHVVCLAP
jgi:hypothetical protein